MEITTQFLFLVPLVIALVEVVKRTFDMSSRFAPALGLFLGVLGAYLFVSQDMTAILQGLFVGLTSMGAYSGVKTSANS